MLAFTVSGFQVSTIPATLAEFTQRVCELVAAQDRETSNGLIVGLAGEFPEAATGPECVKTLDPVSIFKAEWLSGAQQRLQSDVIQQAQVVTHGPGKTGRFLGRLFSVFKGGAGVSNRFVPWPLVASGRASGSVREIYWSGSP